MFPLLAQSQEKGEKRDEELLLGTIPSVFGASRFDQSVTEAPASVSVITATEISAHGWRTLADLLRTVRGFFVTDDRAYTYVGTRGFGRLGDFNTRILLLLDGVRVNEPVFDGGYVGTESLINLADIERVEVIRGPASSLYGTNALFAIINVITAPGRSRPALSAHGGMESFGTRELQLSGAYRHSGAPTLSGSVGARQSDGRDFHFAEFAAPATNNGFATGVDLDRSHRLSGKAEWGAFTLSASMSDRRKHLPTAAYDVSFDDPRLYYRDRQELISLAYKKSIDASSDVAVTVSGHRYDYGADFPFGDTLTTEWTHARWGIVDGQYSRIVGGRHRILIGGMYQHNARMEFVNTTPLTNVIDFSNNTTIDNWALYSLGEFRLGSRLIVNAGLRNDYTRTLGSNLNPRAALIYRLGEGSAIKALYGRAFRAPNNYERYYEDGGKTQKANPGLDRERVTTYELLLEKLFSRHVKGSISAYRYETRQLIDLALDTTDGLQQFGNIGRATGQGIESEVEVEFGEAMARASYSIQRAWDPNSDASLTNSPHHLFFATMVAPLVRDKLRGAVEVRAMSARLSQNDVRVPGHAVANVILTTRAPLGGATVMVGVYNVFDARYRDPVGDEVRMTSIPQDSRALRVSLGWSH